MRIIAASSRDKVCLFLLAALIIACHSLVAESLDSVPQPDDNPLRKGARALQFQIAQNFTITSFQGTAISVKKHLTRKSTLRLGLSLAGYAEASDQVDTTLGTEDTVSILYEKTRQNRDYAISLQYIFYSEARSDVSLFIGAGPVAEWRIQSNDTKPSNPLTGVKYFEPYVHNRTWSLGGIFTMGVEWCFSKSFGLLAEYGLQIKYSNRKNYERFLFYANENGVSVPRVFLSEENIETVSVSPSSARFGISAYF